MDEFADATGLSKSAAPRRYLWTDAFAVCNFLALARETGLGHYVDLARQLVGQVHHVLGRHRSDDNRKGWISGLPEELGRLHPTRGGLRIGKKPNERRLRDTPDTEAEWAQDGQYFHYLTKWIRALLRMHVATRDDRYRDWAMELVLTTHRAFTYRWQPGELKRIYWKMSIDLSRPLVTSMGHHDPLDGLVTWLELQRMSNEPNIELAAAIQDMAKICRNGDWMTEDALGIGGLLDSSVRLSQLVTDSGSEYFHLLERLLADAASSLHVFSRSRLIHAAASQRLAFRELGLSIGLHGVPRLSRLVKDDRLVIACERLHQYLPLAELIDAFWSDEHHRLCRTWQEHQDINSVMLATSLLPEGYFGRLSGTQKVLRERSR